jgi:hypothetical protein
MLPPWIIERLGERERAEPEERPRLELPLPSPGLRPERRERDGEDVDRGVTEIQVW